MAQVTLNLKYGKERNVSQHTVHRQISYLVKCTVSTAASYTQNTCNRKFESEKQAYVQKQF